MDNGQPGACDFRARARYGMVPLLIALWCFGGCAHLPEVRTNNQFRVDGSVTTRAVAEMAPVSQGTAVRAVAVDGGKAVGPGPKIGVIDLDGLILNADFTGPYSLGENPVALMTEKLNAASRDPSIVAVILRINSPGGGAAATDILWRQIQDFKTRCRKPVIACLLDVGTGGAYYLAAGCDLIVASPCTITGGIGVVFNLYNLQDMLALFNIVDQKIKAGNRIDMGAATAPLDDATRAMFQKMANELHKRFQTIVRQGRPNRAPGSEAAMDGRVLLASEAFELGLIDRVGHLEDAIDLARQLAQCPAAVPVLFRRDNDQAFSLYAVTPNTPLQSSLIPMSVPGIDRSKLPTFMYIWQAEPTLERLGGK